MWEWQGGRLENGKISLSMDEAYALIPINSHIRAACKDILKDHPGVTLKKMPDYLKNLEKKIGI